MSQPRPIPKAYKRDLSRSVSHIPTREELSDEIKSGKKHMSQIFRTVLERSVDLARSQSDQQASARSHNQKQDKDMADLRAEIAGLATKVTALAQTRKVYKSSYSNHKQSQSTHRQTNRTPRNQVRCKAPGHSSGSQGKQRATKPSSGHRNSKIVPPTTRSLRSAKKVWVIEVQ